MRASAFVIAGSFALTLSAFAQPRPSGQFQITKVTRALISSPQFTYDGAQQHDRNPDARWLQVEAEFTAEPELTDELTFRYYILVSGKLLIGEVTHANIAAGRENRSVMYLPPRALARFLPNRPVAEAAIQNVAVQIVQQGAVKSEMSLARAQPQWFVAMPKLAGLVLNKNETPFAPLYWDRYEQIKTPPR